MQRIEIEIPLPPHPKQRPRAGKGRSVFKPAKSRAFEKEVALHVKGQLLGRPPITGPVRVSIECSKHGAKLVIEELPASKKSKLRGDVDNYAKSYLDGMNKIAYLDDKQVVELVATKV